MMGISFSKLKKSEESTPISRSNSLASVPYVNMGGPGAEEPRSRSNSLISLQNVNTREPGASGEDVQVLLQKKLNPGYDSTVVAMPAERTKNPQAENYFLSNEAVWGRVFSSCSTTDLLQMRLVSRFFTKIIQDYNQEDDHVLLLSHSIGFASIVRSFSFQRQQENYQPKLILFSRSPTAMIRTVIKNPFFFPTKKLHDKINLDRCILCLLLRKTLEKDKSAMGNFLNVLSEIAENITQKQNLSILERSFSFRGVGWVRMSLTLACFAGIIIGIKILCHHRTQVPSSSFSNSAEHDSSNLEKTRTKTLSLALNLSTPDDSHCGLNRIQAIILAFFTAVIMLIMILCFCHNTLLVCCNRGESYDDNGNLFDYYYSKEITATKEEQQAIFERLNNDIQFFKNKLNPPTEGAREQTNSIISVPIPT